MGCRTSSLDTTEEDIKEDVNDTEDITSVDEESKHLETGMVLSANKKIVVDTSRSFCPSPTWRSSRS